MSKFTLMTEVCVPSKQFADVDAVQQKLSDHVTGYVEALPVGKNGYVQITVEFQADSIWNALEFVAKLMDTFPFMQKTWVHVYNEDGNLAFNESNLTRPSLTKQIKESLKGLFK